MKRGSLHVSVSIRKATGFFEFLFQTAGTVIISCDRCLDDMEQPVETDNRLVVKLGSTYSDASLLSISFMTFLGFADDVLVLSN